MRSWSQGPKGIFLRGRTYKGRGSFTLILKLMAMSICEHHMLQCRKKISIRPLWQKYRRSDNLESVLLLSKDLPLKERIFHYSLTRESVGIIKLTLEEELAGETTILLGWTQIKLSELAMKYFKRYSSKLQKRNANRRNTLVITKLTCHSLEHTSPPRLSHK